MTAFGKARALAMIVPAMLLAGALGSQYIGGLYPCEMCHWQRWGHYAALGLALLALMFAGNPSASRALVWLALLGIVASGAIGVYHAGVEAGIFEGFTQCTASQSSGSNEDMFNDIMSRPLIRCDDVQWSLAGISMAGWNAILSLGSALLIAWLLNRRSERAR